MVTHVPVRLPCLVLVSYTSFPGSGGHLSHCRARTCCTAPRRPRSRGRVRRPCRACGCPCAPPAAGRRGCPRPHPPPRRSYLHDRDVAAQRRHHNVCHSQSTPAPGCPEHVAMLRNAVVARKGRGFMRPCAFQSPPASSSFLPGRSLSRPPSPPPAAAAAASAAAVAATLPLAIASRCSSRRRRSASATRRSASSRRWLARATSNRCSACESPVQNREILTQQ